MIKVIRTPRKSGWNSNDANIQIWEEGYLQCAMNTTNDEAAINNSGEIYLIKNVSYKWYKPSIKEIHTLSGEKLGEFIFNFTSYKVSFTLNGNEFTIFERSKPFLIWFRSSYTNLYKIEVQKNNRKTLALEIEFNKKNGTRIFPASVPRYSFEITTKDLTSLEIICICYIIEQFKARDAEPD